VIIDGRFTVDGAREEVWRQLSDLTALTPLLPGCESIEPGEDGTCRVTAQAKVGPIKARLAGPMRVIDSVPGESMKLRVEGQDSLTGSHVRAAIDFRLGSPGAQRTEVQYSADVLISGRLGSIGQGIMRETVATMLEEFVRRFNARLTGAPIEAQSLGALSVRAATRSIKTGVSSLFNRTEGQP
jgi:carbon monoxide dehydrogenase subunit G